MEQMGTMHRLNAFLSEKHICIDLLLNFLVGHFNNIPRRHIFCKT